MSTKWNWDPVPGIIHGKWRQEFYRWRRKWTVNFISASTLAECFWNFSPICSHQIALSHERTSLDACKKQIPHTLAMELSFFQLSDPRSELKAILVLSRHNRMDQPSRQDNRESNIFLENNFSHFSLWRLLWRLRNDLLSFRSFDSPILPPESHAEFWRWTQNLTEVSICQTIFVQNMFGKNSTLMLIIVTKILKGDSKVNASSANWRSVFSMWYYSVNFVCQFFCLRLLCWNAKRHPARFQPACSCTWVRSFLSTMQRVAALKHDQTRPPPLRAKRLDPFDTIWYTCTFISIDTQSRRERTWYHAEVPATW